MCENTQGKIRENGQNSEMDKTVGYDNGKLLSGVAIDWVTSWFTKEFEKILCGLNVQSDFTEGQK